MPRTKVSVPDLAEVDPGLWSKAIRAGDMLFISGQVARPFEGGTRIIGKDEYEQTKQPYFLAQVVVDDIPSFVKDRLSAGMPADVIFPTGERTVLDYLVRPLKDRLRGVMRER